MIVDDATIEFLEDVDKAVEKARKKLLDQTIVGLLEYSKYNVFHGGGNV